MKVVALAGGVGGAKLVDGLADCLGASDLSVVVNTGDDFNFLGLRICPDLDTVCYTLAGIADPSTGWGRKDETWNALTTLEQLDAPAWFRLGDKDLGHHLDRTSCLFQGWSLSAVVEHFCQRFGIQTVILPMTDNEVATYVHTQDEKSLPFQEYFVHLRCEPKVKGFEFRGVEQSRPAPGVLTAIQEADCVIICPSNPWVSVTPILSVPGVRKALNEKLVVAVSPLIGGKAIKGPAAKMYTELGIEPSSVSVSRHYQGLISGILIDTEDEKDAKQISRLGIIPMMTNVFMRDSEDRKRLAIELLQFCESQLKGKNL